MLNKMIILGVFLSILSLFLVSILLKNCRTSFDTEDIIDRIREIQLATDKLESIYKAEFSRSSMMVKHPTSTLATQTTDVHDYLENENQHIPFLPPNPTFYFHNKMPRCGSTTMRNILSLLVERNKFNLIVIQAKENSIINSEIDLIDYINDLKQEQQDDSITLVIKHNSFVNFTNYGSRQPTFINVIRNPIDRYMSMYQTCRHGMTGQDGKPFASCSGMSSEELDKPVEEFFLELNTTQNQSDNQNLFFKTHYINWLCGANTICQEAHLPSSRSKAYSYTKQLILNEYFTIGILEQLEKSLKLFSSLMPEIYSGANEVLKTEVIQMKATSSSSKVSTTISANTRSWLESTHFKYDIDLYKFVVAKFEKQYEKFVVPFD